jgi:hypothetical protein
MRFWFDLYACLLIKIKKFIYSGESLTPKLNKGN